MLINIYWVIKNKKPMKILHIFNTIYTYNFRSILSLTDYGNLNWYSYYGGQIGIYIQSLEVTMISEFIPRDFS